MGKIDVPLFAETFKCMHLQLRRKPALNTFSSSKVASNFHICSISVYYAFFSKDSKKRDRNKILRKLEFLFFFWCFLVALQSMSDPKKKGLIERPCALVGPFEGHQKRPPFLLCQWLLSSTDSIKINRPGYKIRNC